MRPLAPFSNFPLLQKSIFGIWHEWDESVEFNLQNIIDGQGISIAITGMVIVLFALSAISLFIAALPRILARIAERWPEPAYHHGHTAPAPDNGLSDDVVAAIAVTLCS